MINCDICETHKKGQTPLYENKDWIVREAEKNLTGYLYIEAKVHIESWSEIKPEVMKNYGECLYVAFQEIQKHNPIKIYQVAIAEKVPHLHLHLVPRYSEDLKGLDHLKIALGDGFPIK